jgi:hypothetical protein
VSALSASRPLPPESIAVHCNTQHQRQHAGNSPSRQQGWRDGYEGGEREGEGGRRNWRIEELDAQGYHVNAEGRGRAPPREEERQPAGN